MAKTQVFPATPYYQQDSVPYATSEYKTTARPPAVGLIHSDDFSDFQLGVLQGEFTWTTSSNVTVQPDPDDAGNDTLQFQFIGNADPAADAGAEVRYSTDLHQEIWFKYRLYVPSNYIHRNATGADNNKGFFNIWGDTYAAQDVAMRIEFERKSDTESRIVMYAFQGQNSFSTQINGSTDSDGRIATDLVCIATADLGTWMDIVVNAKVSDRGSTNGRCTVWKNGVLFCDYRDVDNSSAVEASSNAYNGGYLLGYANSGFTSTTDMNIDDYYIGTSAASIGFTVP